MRLGKLFALMAFTFVIARCGFSQMPPDVENGFKHWGSYDGSSVDSVNMMNGAGILHAALTANYGQRGALGSQVFISQNSKLWQVTCHNNASGAIDCYWTTTGQGASLQLTMGLTLQRTIDKNGSATGTTTYSASGYSITTPEGSTHQLSPVPGTLDSTGEATKFDSIDTTGFHLEMSNPDSSGVMSTATVTDRHGNQYVAVFGTSFGCGPMATNHLPSAGGYQPLIDDAPMGDQFCPQQAFAQQVTDTNGNQFTYSSQALNTTALAIDTLARSIPFTTGNTTTDFSGCGSSYPIAAAYLLNYSGGDGSTRHIKVCSAYIAIQTAFNVAGIMEIQNYPTPHTIQFALPVTIILADGTLWTFNYDSYGNLTSIGLPTGGSITYTWTNIAFPSCDPNGGNVSRAVASRTLHDNNGHSYTWNYNWGTVVNGSVTNTVTDPLGNDAVYVFTSLNGTGWGGCGFYETRVQYYQGTGAARQLLKQVDTAYASANFGIESAYGIGLGNVEATSIQTTVYPSGRVSLVTKAYDRGPASGRPIFGNLMTEKVYDWGEGAPGPLLRETDTTYQWQTDSTGNYLAAHLVDLRASVVVKDGSGNRLAETDYFYDEAAYLTSSGITVQHGAPPGPVRGNLTTVKKWLNTNNTWITGHTNWYDTGEVYQQVDPLGHTTTHSYDPYYVGAYSTKTCNALNQCVSWHVRLQFRLADKFHRPECQ